MLSVCMLRHVMVTVSFPFMCASIPRASKVESSSDSAATERMNDEVEKSSSMVKKTDRLMSNLDCISTPLSLAEHVHFIAIRAEMRR